MFYEAYKSLNTYEEKEKFFYALRDVFSYEDFLTIPDEGKEILFNIFGNFFIEHLSKNLLKNL